MLICHKENCACIHHRMLHCLEAGLNDEAKSIFQKLENLCELADTLGFTLLHYSVKYRNYKMAEYLIGKGCDVNVQDVSGVSPLMLAVKASDEKTVEILLKYNADICMTECNGMSSISLAFPIDRLRMSFDLREKESPVILEMIFRNINNDFSKGTSTQWLLNANNSVKLIVMAFANAEITRFMLDNGYPIDFRESKLGLTALHTAIRFAQLENVKMLIDYGANVNVLDEKNRSPLYYYIGGFEDADEDSEVLKSFLRLSASLFTADECGYTSVEHLMYDGKKKTVRTLLLSGIDINLLIDSRTLLFVLIDNQSDDNVLELFDELNIKFNVNERDPEEMTPLMWAAEIHGPEKVEFLLDHGADVNMTTSDGSSALLYTNIDPIACKERQSLYAKKVELLFQYGCRDAQLLVTDDVDYQRLCSMDNFSLVVYVIIAHMALLGALEPSPLTALARQRIESISKLKNHFDMCTRQLEELKRSKVHGSVTLFKLLIAREFGVAAYARNEELFLELSNAVGNLSRLEPYYLNTLQRNLSRGLELAKLQVKVAVVIESFTGLCHDAYHSIVGKIMNYLNRQDLINLSEMKQ